MNRGRYKLAFEQHHELYDRWLASRLIDTPIGTVDQMAEATLTIAYLASKDLTPPPRIGSGYLSQFWTDQNFARYDADTQEVTLLPAGIALISESED